MAIIIGARTLGGMLLASALAMAVLPAILTPLFALLPDLMLTLLMVVMVIAMFFGLLRWMSNGLIGKSATNNMVGILAADLVRWTFGFTFRVAAGLIRTVWRVLQRLFRG